MEEIRLSEPDSEAGPAAREARTKRVWPSVLVAMLVLVIGSLASVVGARTLAHARADRSRFDFSAAAAEVFSTLQLTLQHEDDLVVNLAAYVSSNQDASPTGFHDWITATSTLDRYPELQGLGLVSLVPAADLPAFIAAQEADPFGQLINGKYEVSPPGERDFYCLVKFGQFSGAFADLRVPDACVGEAGAALLATRDAGTGTYGTFELEPGAPILAVQKPAYRGGVVPTTVAERRRLFLGWAAYVMDPQFVMTRSLATHPELALAFYFDQVTGRTTFSQGTPGAHAARELRTLANGWTVELFGEVASDSVFSDGGAVALLVGGIVVSGLVAALILVLATGRIRALGLVRIKTGELRHQALHDSLTGLPNRTLIHDRIEQLLIRNRRNGTAGAALFVDLDGFKNVNDTLGHEAGDLLLQAVSARLTGSLRDADTIGRMGGDEFVVLIDGVSSQADPTLVAERLLEVMRQPFKIGDDSPPMSVTASVGIAIGDRRGATELLRDADVALYQAKDHGRNCYEVFSAALESGVLERQGLEFDLRSALAGNQFRLVYQPIYNLDDLSLTGIEALIRWDHPVSGEIQPDDFISLLESSGQIVEVGRWVLNEACRQMAAWRARGSTLTMSVNVSGRQLDRDDIVEHVREALDASGLAPEALTVEITETALMLNVDGASRRLTQLKKIGVQIAIDDFGTGYSSLAYLQRLPVDCLKIDRSFTETIARSPEADALINTLVQLGKDLGLRTLAEGIETTDQIDHLRGENVNLAQGFLLARPLPPDVIETRLLFPDQRARATGG